MRVLGVCKPQFEFGFTLSVYATLGCGPRGGCFGVYAAPGLKGAFGLIEAIID